MATASVHSISVKPGALPRVAVVLYLLNVGCSLAIPTVLAWLLYGFLHRTEGDVPPFIVWFASFYPVVGGLWWLRLLLVVAANLTFMAWLFALYRGLAQRGARVRFRPHWAVTGFFVPFLNFVRPYQVVSDAWKAVVSLSQPAGVGSVATPVVVKLWWALVCVTIVTFGIGGRAVMPGRMELDAVLLAAYLAGAAASALSIAVIGALERERARSRGAAPVGLLGPWPLPVTASASAVVALVLVLTGAYGFARLEMRKQSKMETAGFGAIPPEVIPPGALPPRPPSSWHLQVQAGATQRVMRLRWIGGGPTDLAGYNVYRREADGAATRINDEPFMSPEFVDENVVSGRTYLYSASAVDTRGSESPRSLEAPGGVEGGVPGGVMEGVVGGLPDAPPPVPVQAVRVGGQIKEPKKLRDVKAVYPDIARQARIQGVVILEIQISPQGKVTDVKVLRSIPFLEGAAVDAVKQWVYTPTVLNGVPVPVIMTVTVSFKLP